MGWREERRRRGSEGRSVSDGVESNATTAQNRQKWFLSKRLKHAVCVERIVSQGLHT